MGYKAVAPAVVAELLGMEPGVIFTADGLTAATGFTREQVAAVISSRIRDGRLTAEVLERGHSWVFRSVQAARPGTPNGRDVGTSGTMFELVRALKTGEFLLESEDGELYVARKVAL